MEFLFKPQSDLNKDQLFQGDLLSRTPVLKEALEKAHGYYADADDYTHFMVLTQSCDLVRRGTKPPKSRYVTLAACRPLSLVLDRARHNQVQKIPGFPLQILAADRKARAAQLLERLLHNTEDGLFFIRRDSVKGVEEDLCTFLPLSVALRSEDHYDACAASKIAELQDIFAAKLGWMAGNLYSRVGTPDFEEKLKDPDAFKRAFMEEFLAEEGLWLTPLQIRWLDQEVRAWVKAHQNEVMVEAVAQEILGRVPPPELIMADAIVDALRHAKLLPMDQEAKARNVLASDNALKRISRQSYPSD